MTYGRLIRLQETGLNREAVAAIAEAVGAVAIFVSLVYVAVQIGQNTRELSRSVEANQLVALERNIEASSHIRELLVLHPEVAQLLLNGNESNNELEALEKFRFGMLLRNIFSGMQGAYIRQLSLEHDPREIEGSKHLLDNILLNRGVREWLERSEPDRRPAFQEIVDLRLEAIKQQI